MRMFGLPESEIARTLREIEAEGVAARRPRDHDLPAARRDRDRDGLRARRRARSTTRSRPRCSRATATALFSRDGSTIDEIVAGLLLGPPLRTIGVAESCTGGLMAGRLTDRAGLLGLRARRARRLLQRGQGRARRRARRADRARTARCRRRSRRRWPTAPRARFGADLGIGITGIAGPGRRDGGEAGRHGLPVASPSAAGERIDRTVHLPGDRADVRERTTTVALHLLRRLLLDAGGWRERCGCSPRSSCRRRRCGRSRRSATRADPRGLAARARRVAARHARVPRRVGSGGRSSRSAEVLRAAVGDAAAPAAGAGRRPAAAAAPRAGAVRVGSRTPTAPSRRSRRRVGGRAGRGGRATSPRRARSART